MNIATSTNIVFERADGSRIPLETSLEMCAEAGYRELDLCFVDLTTVPSSFKEENWREYIRELGNKAEQLGVKFTQAHAPIQDFCNDQADQELAWEWVCRSIEGAGILGIKWIVVHPSTRVIEGEMDQSTHQENVIYFKKLAEYAKGFGVGIAIENMWGKTNGVKRYAIEAEELVKLIEDIAYDNVGACWDTEHGAIENIDQPAAIRLLGDKLVATHISDLTSPQHVHILPYVGFVEWEAIYKAFGEIEYKGVFAFEMQHYLLRMPFELMPHMLRLSCEVGSYMINKINEYKNSDRFI
ncbi:MAG: sugar phosphate isomerase/epimerase family protein [Cellulosilyticaceae bacterium]